MALRENLIPKREDMRSLSTDQRGQRVDTRSIKDMDDGIFDS